ncbi:MAG: type II toxin-antitoxin system Phd/YefM family antitoxin [Methanosarcinaceae archaeon]
MIIKTIDIKDTQLQFAELLSLVSKGTEIIFKRDNTPLARLSPVAKVQSKPRIAGLHEGAIWMSDDFNAPLPDSFWLGTMA